MRYAAVHVVALGDCERVFYSCWWRRCHFCFFFSSRRRHTRSVSAFLLNRSSDLHSFLLLLSLLLPSLLIMFIPSTFKRPVSSWKALNLRKTLLMASSVRLKPLNCSRLPCVYAQETLTFLLTQKKTC